MLDPAVAAGTVPLGIVCGVFAYSFKRRKAACDEVIDDPPAATTPSLPALSVTGSIQSA